MTLKIKGISNKDDFTFLDYCYSQSDFKSNISTNVENDNEVLILKKDDNNIGVFIPCLEHITELVYSRPVLYILKEFRNKASIIICKAIEYLFEVKEVDRVIIQIYQNNIQMINSMKNLSISYRGRINIMNTESKKKRYLYFYDIDFDKYEELRRDFGE